MRRRVGLDGLVAGMERSVCAPGDDDDTRARKAHFALAMMLVVPAGVVWGLLYLALGATGPSLLPFSYAVLSVIDMAVLRRTRVFRVFQTTQVALIILLPFVLQLSLGGYASGSAVIIWGLLGPLIVALFAGERESALWFGAFFGTLLVAAAVEPGLDSTATFAGGAVRALFVMNVGVPTGIAFAMLVSLGRSRRRLRELEVTYLDQTVMLREREKLATLGTLAAGVAHELNNPAAAVRRSAEQLLPALAEMARVTSASRPEPPATGEPVSPLALARQEEAVEEWLAARGIDKPWELAAELVAAGYDLDALGAAAEGSTAVDLAAVLTFLARAATAVSLAQAIAIGAERISVIVGSLKSYSYLDRGTWQTVDITEGIESTLVLLQARLRDMEVVRQYEPDLPPVEVRGNELNQVWTNIVDNAVQATDGTGRLTVRAYRDDGWVVVELEDDGPGIPSGVVERVFDPFFSTKAPGTGTGLGLNISHNIVVQQHGGQLTVTSSPGATCFKVELPLERSPGDGADGSTSPERS